MQELCCPTCGQRYSGKLRNCPKDGAPLLSALPAKTKNIAKAPIEETLDLSKTIPEQPPPIRIKQGLSTYLAPGMQIGEYALLEKIGVGGMGEVWKAQQPTIGKVAAIKVLTQESASSKKNVARFVQEARAVNEIRHPNLVDIFSFGELPDLRPYFIMEHLDGQSLGEYMKRGALPFSEVLKIFEQVCDVLQAAHDKGIVHRDLKPDNIFLLNRSGNSLFVKVLDFGIAKLAGESNQNLTDQGAVFGTPGYMSPEQYEETKNVDHRTDLYALGVILFEMLTGRSPFDEPGLGMYELIIRQMSTPAPIASRSVEGRKIPSGVDALIQKMLAKKPEDRPGSCKEVWRLLLAAAAPYRHESRAELKEIKPVFGDKGATVELTEVSRDRMPAVSPSPVDIEATIRQPRLDPKLFEEAKRPTNESTIPEPPTPGTLRLQRKEPPISPRLLLAGAAVLFLSILATYLALR